MILLAKTFFGLEEVLANEIRALGGKNIEQLNRAVRFEGDQKLLYQANMELRTALSILVQHTQFKTKHENHFYKKIKETDWTSFFGLGDTFAVNAITQSNYLTHSKYLALKAKDAIVDQFRETNEARQRPSIDTKNPDFKINIHLSVNNVCTVSLDSSGDALFKRGYRERTGSAPINEVLAAGMIALSGWQGDCDFVDAMCGSGTIPIEAAMIAYGIAPNVHRKRFGFHEWKDFNQDIFAAVRQEVLAKEKEFHHNIYGYDRDNRAVRLSEDNTFNAKLNGKIIYDTILFSSLKPRAEKGILMMNPPYDERMGIEDITEFYKSIGDGLKTNWHGWEAYIISSNLSAVKRVGLRPSRKIPLFNGPLECRLMKYELYAGTRRKDKVNEPEEDKS